MYQSVRLERWTARCMPWTYKVGHGSGTLQGSRCCTGLRLLTAGSSLDSA